MSENVVLNYLNILKPLPRLVTYVIFNFVKSHSSITVYSHLLGIASKNKWTKSVTSAVCISDLTFRIKTVLLLKMSLQYNLHSLVELYIILTQGLPQP